MEMPKSIKRFELLFLGSLVLGVFQSALMLNSIGVEDPEVGLGGSAFALFILLLIGAIVLATSRKKSVVGKWVLVAFFLLGLVGYIPILAVLMDAPASAVISGAQFGLQAFALYELFTDDASQWFASKSSRARPTL